MKNEDLISRQAVAIDAVHYEYDSCCNIDESGSAIADDIERIIDNVPSAQLGTNLAEVGTNLGLTPSWIQHYIKLFPF